MMKKIINNTLSALLLLLLTGAAGMVFQACEGNEEDMPMPEIFYIRKADPAKSDSLVTHAFMGEHSHNRPEPWQC